MRKTILAVFTLAVIATPWMATAGNVGSIQTDYTIFSNGGGSAEGGETLEVQSIIAPFGVVAHYETTSGGTIVRSPLAPVVQVSSVETWMLYE